MSTLKEYGDISKISIYFGKKKSIVFGAINLLANNIILLSLCDMFFTITSCFEVLAYDFL